MMKMKLWSTVTAAAVLLGGAYGISGVQNADAAGGAGAGTGSAASTASTSQGKTLIGAGKAEAYALKAAPGRVVSIDLEKKLSGTYYEVEIRSGNKEIDVRVEAYSGKILSVRKETDDDDDDDHYSSSTAASQNGTLISAAKAAEAAAASVKGTVTEVDLDRDDGSVIYEVKIRNGKVSTEVGVDAYTAKILYTDVDSDDDDD
ncbi:PepSY domain-containing protein [Paenibacillus sp. MMS20-IR301]|uniref:PepSY domain-containing protein n=1 Tax=Paenibacillus sp. MMS20-IR301 TaxID=2895946 RepID=UPI0028EB696C|nr:PepSY domain-containing protein [Paenibacillus sp. MMS20-IR301]WNS41424.1 PepSY domain-containing protein [Paenibacillus sp. MMS20-IR301]